MNCVKKVSLLFCLVFSLIFLFGNVFSVQAALITNVYDDQVLEQSLDQKHPDKEVVVCSLDYVTLDDGEQEIILDIKDINGWVRNSQPDNWYRFLGSNYKISDDGLSAKIFISVYRIYNGNNEKFDLTFELKAN